MENHPSCSIMSYPWGTTSDNFHLTTSHKDTSLFSPGGSWLLTNLLYHILGVNNHSYISIKFNLLQLRNTHISDILLLCICFSEKLPHALTSQLHFETCKWKLFLNGYLLSFLLITVSFLTYLIMFTPDKTLLIFQLSLTYPFHVYDQS